MDIVDMHGKPFEFFAATFKNHEYDPNLIHIFITGVNESGTKNVAVHTWNIMEESLLNAIRQTQFVLRGCMDSIRTLNDARKTGDFDGIVVTVKPPLPITNSNNDNHNNS